MSPLPSQPPRPLLRSVALCAVLCISLGLIACSGERPSDQNLSAYGIPLAKEQNELSTLRRIAIDRLIDFRVATGARAGFVTLVAQNGGLAYARTAGWADIESKRPMALDTPFQLASNTKPITAVAAMILVEEARLSLDDPVAKYLPGFADMRVLAGPKPNGEWETEALAEPIRVHHLLTFTSGIGGYAETEEPLDQRWRSPDIEDPGLGSLADRVGLIPRLPLYEQPGESWRYGWSFDVLARVIEVAAGQPYDQFLQERLFGPLKMNATHFPDAVPASTPIASMYTHSEDGSLIREERFDAHYGRGWSSGGGGLVSTAPDYLRFALMLWQGGSLDGVRILKPETVDQMTRLQVQSGVLSDMGIEGLGWGLGVSVVADSEKTPMPARNGDYWWSGRFGTHLWISPATGTLVVLMQQTERNAYSDLPYTASLVQLLATP